jgi:hypothetical protein
MDAKAHGLAVAVDRCVIDAQRRQIRLLRRADYQRHDPTVAGGRSM